MKILLYLQWAMLAHAFLPGIRNDRFLPILNDINGGKEEVLVGKPHDTNLPRKQESAADEREGFGLPLKLQAKDVQLQEIIPNVEKEATSNEAMDFGSTLRPVKLHDARSNLHSFGRLSNETGPLGIIRSNLSQVSDSKRKETQTNALSNAVNLRHDAEKSLAEQEIKFREIMSVTEELREKNYLLKSRLEEVEKVNKLLTKENIRFRKDVDRFQKKEKERDAQQFRRQTLANQEDYWGSRVKADKENTERERKRFQKMLAKQQQFWRERVGDEKVMAVPPTLNDSVSHTNQSITEVDSQNEEEETLKSSTRIKSIPERSSLYFGSTDETSRSQFLIEQKKRRAKIQRLRDSQMAKLKSLNSVRHGMVQSVKEPSLLERMVQKRFVEDTMKEMGKMRTGFFRHYETSRRLQRSRSTLVRTMKRQRRTGFFRHYL